ncbi:MAG: hypothetical protein Q7T33_04285 [Dehalococcoidia bacterium]|nr:hypothetical protein [Dehalococcoidia bacterium]
MGTTARARTPSRSRAYITYASALAALVFAAAACGGGNGGNGGNNGNNAGPSATAPSQTPAPTAASPAALSPAPTAADAGPPGGKIAFVTFRDGDQEVYIMNADGSDERNVTKSPASDDFDPAFSRDGKLLAFVSNRLGVPQVFVMNVDGSGLYQLTRDGGQSPHFSSDGRKMAYSNGGDVVVSNADGTDARVVMQAEGRAEAAPALPSGRPCRAGSFPGTWSPDDTEISYYSATTTPPEAQLCTVKADGSDIRVLVADAGAYDVEPMWSPDGQDILYRAIIDGVHDIWIVNVASGQRTNVTNSPELDVEPDWSPDGRWVVFAALQSGMPNFDIYITPREGGEQIRLTEADAKDAHPSWAP